IITYIHSQRGKQSRTTLDGRDVRAYERSQGDARIGIDCWIVSKNIPHKRLYGLIFVFDQARPRPGVVGTYCQLFVMTEPVLSPGQRDVRGELMLSIWSGRHEIGGGTAESAGEGI